MTNFPKITRRTALAGLGAALAAPSLVRAQGAQVVNIYSSRHYEADQILFQRFTAESGVRVNLIEAEFSPLMQRLRTEGRNSPADVLIAVTIASLWQAHEAGMFQPVRSATLEETIPPHLRDPEGNWFAQTMRARVIIHSKERVRPAQVPTYESLADAAWRGKIAIRSSNHVYNQSLLASIIAAHGAERAEAWSRAVGQNLVRPPQGGDTDQIMAVASGQADLAVSNTYYLGRLVRSTRPEERAAAERVGLIFPNQGDRGTHVNISGAGVARNAPNRDNAVKFLEFMVSPEAQRIIAEENNEYPVRSGVAPTAAVVAFGQFRADTINLAQLGRLNAEAVRITDRTGWR